MSDNDPLDEAQHERDEAADRILTRSLIASLSVRDVFTALLVVSVVAGLVGVVYVALTPQQAADTYTEFYILGSEGNASDYPTNLTVDERAAVTVGVVNHEQQRMRYTIIVGSNERALTTRTITVDKGQKWERPVSYSIGQPGRTRVRFLLYRGSVSSLETRPYRELRLWTNVSSPRT